MALAALGALELQHNLLRSLHLLLEHGLGLTTITGLLAIVTALTLGSGGGLTGFLLPSNRVRLVRIAAFAESILLLRIINHDEGQKKGKGRGNGNGNGGRRGRREMEELRQRRGNG